MTGPAACMTAARSIGACFATKSFRKSYQRLKVSGASESTCVPFVNVNHLRLVPVKFLASVGQWPPVCSSVHWQAMNVGALILLTNVTGESGSATDGT